ncbi:MAG: 2,3-bisphosphoglycerate-independent phosphoglycerate mutase [Chloroflexota bacterium]|nr:2,3-bisphosphoglycerate-independent phosphoglycerate mutase [Chloroflexota bacterium]
MIDFPALSDIVTKTQSKIVMLVCDGLGGLAHPDTRKSELETANIPNLDKLARVSATGLTIPVLPGIAPGSGPGHLALFGYDPVKYLIGRGVLEALGIGVNLEPGDIAARGNFCTVDTSGIITDRRAGRISTEESAPLVEMLDRIDVPEIKISVYSVKDYRFVLKLSGASLSEQVTETDPQRLGEAPLIAKPVSSEGAATAEAVNAFVTEAQQVLAEHPKANMLTLRGFSALPQLPSMNERYLLDPAAIAAYPMYRGLASLLGMNVIPTGTTFEEEIGTMRQHWEEHDFFFIHYKPADAAGEDGDFDTKVRTLEELDHHIPELLSMKPDVFMVAGDHATPAIMASHSWHPVPFLLHSRLTLGEGVESFSERVFATGSLGRFQAEHIMLQAMSHADKLTKFGP